MRRPTIPIPMEDEPLHTSEHPFCSDPTCPCHEDPDLIDAVADLVACGELSAEEATDLVTGSKGRCA